MLEFLIEGMWTRKYRVLISISLVTLGSKLKTRYKYIEIVFTRDLTNKLIL